MNYSDRREKLIKFLRGESLDAFLVRKKENIAYLTGARGEDAVLFISARDAILITDSRYEEEYKKNAERCSVRITGGGKNLWETIAEACDEADSKSIGFESASFVYQEYESLKKRLSRRKLTPLTAAVENLRVIKDSGEIHDIRQACKYGVQLMNYAVKAAKPGVSENSVKAAIEAYALKNDIKLAGFEIIVASGVNASMPHAVASQKRIKKHDMVVIDLGAAYLGYNSDLTRTVSFGKINRNYSALYNIVLASQAMAIESLKPGVYAKDIDAISRRYISDRGVGSFFIHSLGHGVGRETHEIPAISRTSKIKLEQGMVITIEPGIYIPGWGGIRIEDTVLITADSCEVLTKGAIKYAGRD